MKRLVIAVDCDDVLVPTLERTVAAYNKSYGTNLQLKDFYGPATLETWGTTDEQEAVNRVHAYIESEDFAQVPPALEAVAAIKRLSAFHELHIVTGRSERLEPVTTAMCNTYFADCFSGVEHTNYFYAGQSRTKGEVCRAINADVLIDDHIVHGESVLSYGLREVLIFGDYPWNQTEELAAGMKRCRDWDAVEKEIARIAEGAISDVAKVTTESIAE